MKQRDLAWIESYSVKTHPNFIELDALLFYILYAYLCSLYVELMICTGMFDVFSIHMCARLICAEQLNWLEKVLKSWRE